MFSGKSPDMKRLILILLLIFLAGYYFLICERLDYKNYENNFQTEFYQTFEYKLAKRLNGYRFGSCSSFAFFWEKITNKKCQRIKTGIGTWHWICPVNEELGIWIDSNYYFDNKIRIFKK